jgi:hypothetical protein
VAVTLTEFLQPNRPEEGVTTQLQAVVTLHLHTQHEPLVELAALFGRVSGPSVAASGAVAEHVLEGFDLFTAQLYLRDPLVQ